jgi:hypothetical protein
MKLLVRSFGVAGALLMLAGVHDASAQITDSVEFTTSFPFTVGNATVPAGSYTVAPDVDNPSILQLTGGRTSVLFETNSAQARETPSKTEVVFKRYGDGYVLKDIWMEGESIGAESLTAEPERHMMKHAGRAAEQRVAGRRKSHSSK